MPGFNPWVDVAIIASIWVPAVGTWLFCEWRKSKTQKALRGATRM